MINDNGTKITIQQHPRHKAKQNKNKKWLPGFLKFPRPRLRKNSTLKCTCVTSQPNSCIAHARKELT